MPGRIFTSILIGLGQAACVMASEAEGPADQGLFSGELGESIWTVVAFTALVLILGRFAWRPLLASLKAREDHIQARSTPLPPPASRRRP